MLYHLHMTDRADPEKTHSVLGDYDYLSRYAKANAPEFECLLGPAHYDHVKDRVAELEADREKAIAARDRATLDARSYRAQQVSVISAEIQRLRHWLADSDAKQSRRWAAE